MSAHTAPNRVGPGVPLGVTEQMIARLVHAFYAKIRADSVLGKTFGNNIIYKIDTLLLIRP